MTLPTAPSRTMDAVTFDTTTDAFIVALPQFETDMNALAVAMNLNSTTDTSTTSVTIGTGTKVFTVSASKSFWPGMWLVIADTAAPTTNAMFCQVTSYTGTTLTTNAFAIQGSGVKASWQISQSAPAALSGLYASLTGATFSGLVNLAAGANIASGATIDLTAATGNTVVITGTVATSALTMNAGQTMMLIADGAWPLTYHATTMNINGGVSYTCAAGDRLLVTKDAGGVIRVNVLLSANSTVLTGVPVAPTAAAGTNTTQIATTAFVCDTGWWESAEQDITSGAVISVAHGLGRLPKDLQCIIRCITTDLGYTAGDEVQFGVGNQTATAYIAPSNQWASATNVGISLIVHANPIAIAHKTTGTQAAATSANWKIVFRAR